MKIKSFLIVLGAILACTAPYVHMIFPKNSKEIIALEQKLDKGMVSQHFYDEEMPKLKEAQKIFGFTNARNFGYAIGMPLTMFFFAVLFLGFAQLVGDVNMRRVGHFSALILFFISIYHIIWIVWDDDDLPKSMYHLSIVVMAIMATLISHLLAKYRTGLKKKMGKLIRFISVEAYYKYIRQEDRDAYIQDSFSVYDDITKP